MTTDLALPCLYCSRPAAPHGEHHYRERNPRQGKGMGGTHQHLDTVVLCRDHHRSLHDKRWRLIVAEDMASGFKDGDREPLFTRPLVLDDDHVAPEFWTSEKLADALFVVEKEAALMQGRICAVFWARSRWYEDWPQAASDAIGSATGRHIGPRTIRRLANLYLTTRDHFGGDVSWIENLGQSVAYYIAESKEPAPLLEEAKRLREGGATSGETLAGLRNDTGVNRERHTCSCGDEHYRKEA